jgi:putative hemolysin
MRPAFRACAGLAALLSAVAQGGSLRAQAPSTGLANPASVNCARAGGQSVIRNGPQGQFGVGIFPNGRVCEEWALLRDQRCVRPPG